ncbi:HK97 family phage prohead protease [Moraxella bovis]|uniref:HK97 family phage prohead protease n=1 Tax=Moraxella bovis TaxID=476 RepID=UPI000992A25D|nr:HK97 family phage prohead protease [Moraxella bovis]OOR89824.1 peptidase U35 [Moraxella bovis]
MTKAYSTLQIKSVTDTDDERIITGIATTPSTDRDDDILEPTGAKFTLPIPLLSHHNHSQPIGEVIQAEVTAGGILITAKIAKIDEEGKLKERIDEAWQSIKSGLIKGLSVGFKIKEYSYIENSWGLHIKEWEWWELSIVTIPANADSVITSVKQIKSAFDRQNLPPLDAPEPIINPISPNLQPKPTQKSNSSNGGVALILPTNGVKLV